MYNIPSRSLHVTIVAMERQLVLLILCARARMLYSHVWHVWLFSIFQHYFISFTILGKKVLNIKCVF
jgi:hypothetical protein